MARVQRRKEERMLRMSDYARVFVTCIAGIFGTRTPPEPEVIPHMSPVKGPEGSAPPRTGDVGSDLTVVLPSRKTPGGSPAGSTIELPGNLEVSLPTASRRSSASDPKAAE